MTSKHDILTAIITVVIIAAGVTLDVTGHLTGGMTTTFAGLGASLFSYWFARGGAISATGTTPDVQSIVQTEVANQLNSVAQTPAKVAGTNESDVQSSGIN